MVLRRTVIGPDPTLRVGELAMPPAMAKNLTKPVKVTNFNIVELTKLVNEGKVNYVLKDNGQTRINMENAIYSKGTRLNHGDIVVRNDEEILVTNGKMVLEDGDIVKRDGKILPDIKYPGKREYTLNIGDICERQLQNGDVVLLKYRAKTDRCFYG